MIGPVLRWARSRSLVAFPIVGVLPSPAFASWRAADGVGRNLGLPLTRAPRHADVLLVVGELTHKLAPVVLRAHQRLARPSFVLHITGPSRTPSYALAELDSVLPVDVRVVGDPPNARALGLGVERLRALVQAREVAS